MDLLNESKFKKLVYVVISLLALFLFSKSIYEIKSISELGFDKPASNTITVSGNGEAVAIPDIATFSFSVTKEAKTSAEAQKLVTDASSKVLDVVKKDGVEDKDVKTTNYSLYPKYDYPQVVCPTIYPSVCPPSKEVLRGYEVSQSFEVKIRSTDKVGQIVSDVTSAGVTNINGPTFGVDKEDDVIAKARNEAIVNAKAKAESIAQGLGVKLVRIVNFSENENGYVAPVMMNSSFAVGSADMKSAPQLPAGENKYSRTVNITYEIR